MDDRSTTTAGDPALIQELLVDELRDLLHAEGQLVKALPKMVKAAQSDVLKLRVRDITWRRRSSRSSD